MNVGGLTRDFCGMRGMLKSLRTEGIRRTRDCATIATTPVMRYTNTPYLGFRRGFRRVRMGRTYGWEVGHEGHSNECDDFEEVEQMEGLCTICSHVFGSNLKSSC